MLINPLFLFSTVAIASLLTLCPVLAGELHEAVERGDIDEVERLIAQGHDVNKKDQHGSPPLHGAAVKGYEAIAELLINQGARVNRRGSGNDTALHWAAYEGHEAVAKLLIAHGADLNANIKGGGTPRDWAQSDKMVELLVSAEPPVPEGVAVSAAASPKRIWIGYVVVGSAAGLIALAYVPAMVRRAKKRRQARPKESEQLTPSRDVTMLNKGDPPVRIDPKSITHAFVAVTHNDIGHSDTATKAVADLNRACQPRLWGTEFKARFVSFAVNSGPDGFPDPTAVPVALEKVGLSPTSSIVVNTMTVSFDKGRTESKVLSGFGFRDQNPKIILPYGDACIPSSSSKGSQPEPSPTLLRARGRNFTIYDNFGRFSQAALRDRDAALYLEESKKFLSITEKLDEFMKRNTPEKSFAVAVPKSFIVCPKCKLEYSFQQTLSVIDAAPDNSVSCPQCGAQAILYVYSNPSTEDVRPEDVQLLKAFSRYQAQFWWEQKSWDEVECSFTCKEKIKRGGGFYTFNKEVTCAKCAKELFGSDEKILQDLRKDRNYWGPGLLDRAREWALTHKREAQHFLEEFRAQ